MGERLRSLLAAALITALPAAAAAQEPRGPADFAAHLTQLSAAVADATPEAALELGKKVPAVWHVQHGPLRYDIPAGWLSSALRAGVRDPAKWPDERSKAVERLEALAGESMALAQFGETASAADARAALDKVLADPEFSRLHADTAMQQLWNRIVERFARVLRRLGLGRVAQAATAEVIAWTISLVALGALVVWLVSALRQSPLRTRLPQTDPSTPRMSARAWARRAMSATDVRDAVSCGYRAAMARLEEEGVWRVDEARTPREYLRLLPESHRRRPAVADVSRRFEEIWYGARDATDDDRRSLLGRLRELECLPAE